jgi:hypothetical protein
MKLRHLRTLRLWVVLLVVSRFGKATAQFPTGFAPREEPRWLTLDIREVSAGVYAEGTYETATYQNSSGETKYSRLFVGPTLGLSFGGSVYHPNFLTYNVISEGAFGWAGQTVESSGGTTHRNEFDFLGWFNAGANLFPTRPYTLNVFSSYDHSYRDYDFFNRVIVDTWRYGARASITTGPWNFYGGYAHRDEKYSGITGISARNDDTVDAGIRNQRKIGTSSLTYTLNQYDYAENQLGQSGVGEGRDHFLNFTDSELFGSRDQYRLNSSASYAHREQELTSNDEFQAEMALDATHKENLNSFYDFSYDNYSTRGFDSDSYSGRAYLRHQLYDSLVSIVSVRALDYEADASFSDGYTRRYGGGLTEDYSKQLGGGVRLRLSNTVYVDHTDQKSVSMVVDERHIFGEDGAPPDSFFLNSPNVIVATILVTDINNTQPGYLEYVDYVVIPFGSRTQIQRLPGSRIPAAAPVLVDYRTLPTPEGSYESFNDYVVARLEFWQNMLGLYSRLEWSRNNAPEDLQVQNVTSYVFGGDFTWRWFRTGAEYQIYQSDAVDYNTTRLFQSAYFDLDGASSLTFDLSESWVKYQSIDRTQDDYRFTTRYHRALTRRLSFDVAAGVAYRSYGGDEDLLATFRPSIKYQIGKLTVEGSYDFEYQNYFDREQRQRQVFYVRARRIF